MASSCEEVEEVPSSLAGVSLSSSSPLDDLSATRRVLSLTNASPLLLPLLQPSHDSVPAPPTFLPGSNTPLFESTPSDMAVFARARRKFATLLSPTSAEALANTMLTVALRDLSGCPNDIVRAALWSGVPSKLESLSSPRDFFLTRGLYLAIRASQWLSVDVQRLVERALYAADLHLVDELLRSLLTGGSHQHDFDQPIQPLWSLLEAISSRTRPEAMRSFIVEHRDALFQLLHRTVSSHPQMLSAKLLIVFASVDVSLFTSDHSSERDMIDWSSQHDQVVSCPCPAPFVDAWLALARSSLPHARSQCEQLATDMIDACRVPFATISPLTSPSKKRNRVESPSPRKRKCDLSGRVHRLLSAPTSAMTFFLLNRLCLSTNDPEAFASAALAWTDDSTRAAERDGTSATSVGTDALCLAVQALTTPPFDSEAGPCLLEWIFRADGTIRLDLSSMATRHVSDPLLAWLLHQQTLLPSPSQEGVGVGASGGGGELRAPDSAIDQAALVVARCMRKIPFATDEELSHAYPLVFDCGTAAAWSKLRRVIAVSTTDTVRAALLHAVATALEEIPVFVARLVAATSTGSLCVDAFAEFVGDVERTLQRTANDTADTHHSLLIGLLHLMGSLVGCSASYSFVLKRAPSLVPVLVKLVSSRETGLLGNEMLLLFRILEQASVDAACFTALPATFHDGQVVRTVLEHAAIPPRLRFETALDILALSLGKRPLLVAHASVNHGRLLTFLESLFPARPTAESLQLIAFGTNASAPVIKTLARLLDTALSLGDERDVFSRQCIDNQDTFLRVWRALMDEAVRLESSRAFALVRTPLADMLQRLSSRRTLQAHLKRLSASLIPTSAMRQFIARAFPAGRPLTVTHQTTKHALDAFVASFQKLF